MKMLVQLGNYISVERRFLKASTICLGIPAATFGVMAFNEYGAIVSLITVVVAFLGSYVWGLIMWHFVFRDIYSRRRAMTESSTMSKVPGQDQ
jgi:hypothetical protein